MFKDESKAYCDSNNISINDIEIDEFEITSCTDNVNVFFEMDEQEDSMSLRPIIKAYIGAKYEELKTPVLIGKAYDAHTIEWTWPNDEEFAHYLVEEPINFNNEEDKLKIIAQLPIGINRYVETSLEPNTAYTRRIYNYTDDQTSYPSSAVTVITETVEATKTLQEFKIEPRYDFTTSDEERQIIEENLSAFHSGIGDNNDLKVYKQMDADFYQKFKAYFELSGRRLQRERRYDQVGFYYKVCLDAVETVEDRKGEVTFDLNVYPREEATIKTYMYGTRPVNVYGQIQATAILMKEGTQTQQATIKTLKKEVEFIPGTPGTPPTPGTDPTDPEYEIVEVEEEITVLLEQKLSIIFCIDNTGSVVYLFNSGTKKMDGPNAMKIAFESCIDTRE